MILLFASASTGFVEFEEVEGESEERRRARLARHQRSQQRAVCVSLSYHFAVFLLLLFFVSFCVLMTAKGRSIQMN